MERTLSSDAPAGTSAPTRLVFHDGGLVPPEAATLAMGSIALRYGVSVFEGVRLYRPEAGGRPAPWLLEPHLARLRSSLALVRVPDPGVQDVPGIVDAVVAANAADDDAYCRIAISAGNAGQIDDPVRPVLTVSVSPMARKRWLERWLGMRVQISSWTRCSESAFPAAAKNISSYAGSRIALLEAKDAGYDTCLLRSAQGFVSEAPTAAVFAVREGTLRTPRLHDGVLPSVTRAWVIAVADRVGLPVRVAALTPDDVRGADEVFLCGTGLEFAGVASVDGVPCPGWPAAPVMRRLVDRYFQETRGLVPPTRVDWTPRD